MSSDDKWFYIGDAYNTKTKKDRSVILYAATDKDASRVYMECIKRYDHIIAVEDPGLVRMTGGLELVNDQCSDDMKREFSE